MTKPATKSPTKPKHVYQLKITLDDSKPKIWRRVLVPATIPLGKLHQVIQLAMGWQDCHLHSFTIEDNTYCYPHPDTDWEIMGDIDYRRITLTKVVPVEKATFSYEYDFGDGWTHQIEVEKIFDAAEGMKSPVCVAGERACPPEDVGGVGGYAEFLKAISKPKHAQHAHYLEWIGGTFDPEAFDLDAVNAALTAIRS